MRRVLISAWLAVLLLAIPLAQSQADDKDSWVGKTVFPKKLGTHFGVTRDGKDVDFGVLNQEIHYKVVGEEGPWIKVRQQGKEGWFAKEDAVPLEKAVDYFTARIQANEKDAVAYQARGTVWKLRGELDIAIKDFNDAIRLAPTESAYWNSRGMLWSNKKEYDKAIKDYDEAVRLKPTESVKSLFHKGSAA